MKMKRTPWFPANTHPARRGWYERDHRQCWEYINPAERIIAMDWWEPVKDKSDRLYPGVWYVQGEPYNFINPFTHECKWVMNPMNDASRQDLPWRGITEDPVWVRDHEGDWFHTTGGRNA